ncbi:MAG: hypothetical protein ABW185_11040 [Sedimenticola sp.]
MAKEFVLVLKSKYDEIIKQQEIAHEMKLNGKQETEPISQNEEKNEDKQTHTIQYGGGTPSDDAQQKRATKRAESEVSNLYVKRPLLEFVSKRGKHRQSAAVKKKWINYVA